VNYHDETRAESRQGEPGIDFIDLVGCWATNKCLSVNQLPDRGHLEALDDVLRII
jgi:hypothetical protein